MPDATPKLTPRILIVDDHPLVRDGLRTRLDSEPGWSVCGEADDVASALRLLEETQPDVAVVDLSLKSGNGIDLIKRIVSRNRGVRIVVSSMHDEHIYAERAINAGAMGYVHKHEAADLIVDAIREVLAGRLYASEVVRERLLERVIRRAGNARANPVEQLTDRELQVFERIGRGRSVREISDELKVSPKTIETYRDRIRKKLQLESASRLVHYAVKWVTEHNSQ
ncbi:MAG TPA: response regulator transcription factor [Planctomycetaceae bacterium]|nr:response regulator transcription factor [Planctomycetaceae bacterium]